MQQHGHRGTPATAEAIESQRRGKDASFRSSPSSPLPSAVRHAFTGLSYYAVDPRWRFAGLVLAPVEPSTPLHITMPTSDGDSRPATRVGRLHFSVAGTRYRLTAFDLGSGHPGSLFVPFQDATSGRETYGAGRYLDLDPGMDGTVTLDFNLAYHPWCAYSPDFSCPMTPQENRLPIAVRAGERPPVDGIQG